MPKKDTDKRKNKMNEIDKKLNIRKGKLIESTEKEYQNYEDTKC